jgi:hypothetical protein
VSAFLGLKVWGGYYIFEKWVYPCIKTTLAYEFILLISVHRGWFENRVLGRIFGSKKDEVTSEWRKLHNQELNDLYCSPNIVRVIKSRRMWWAGHVTRVGERRGAYRVVLGKREWKGTFGEIRRRREDNIELDLQELGCGGMDSIDLAQIRDRYLSMR